MCARSIPKNPRNTLFKRQFSNTYKHVCIYIPWGDLERSLAEKEAAAKHNQHNYMYVCTCNNPKLKESRELRTMFSRARN